MCGSMVDIQSLTAEIRRGKKKEERRKIEITGQKYNGPLLQRTTIKKKKETTEQKYSIMACPITVIWLLFMVHDVVMVALCNRADHYIYGRPM